MIEVRKPETPEQKAERKRKRELSDLNKILENPEGRRVMWKLLSKTQLFADGYVASDNGYGTTRNMGVKSVGLWLLNEIMDARPTAFTQMQREHSSESKREQLVDEQYIDSKDILETSDN